LAIEPVDLARVVQAVVSDIEPVRQRALTVRLPQPAAPVLAHVDSLGIVLANLLPTPGGMGARRPGRAVGRPERRPDDGHQTDDGPGASAEVLQPGRIERTDRRSGDGLPGPRPGAMAAQMGADLRFVSQPRARQAVSPPS
jgi:hypothetical protein